MATTYDALSAMMAWEDGTLSTTKTLDLFQHLVDTGQAWTLQGAYGRMAAFMINAGLIHQ